MGGVVVVQGGGHVSSSKNNFTVTDIKFAVTVSVTDEVHVDPLDVFLDRV